MPGFDGTGPRGMGPMTGGGRGLCRPWGIGRGFRTGAAMGWGGYGRPDYGMRRGLSPVMPQMSRDEELYSLSGQARAIREELNQIEARIKQLEGQG